ncbi:hypothetical protein PQE75_gp233 [Bacillus phage vB_BcoS-136]|uniref:Prohead protease n=1 Tax=Bacillus phage vB_BcoS-136 TaxID=2419619 RepID=A0A3G3BVZ1_9CAUD|nr:hypothetical protein PQE75_gp233 [Bacillus phage vB_BcoS-136]AYP68246.1 hypothetical protein vBBcoS136_00131 [Bacillus phage vB_BcoS-136]
MTKKKLLDFQASISDVKQINPLFSTAKARVLYTGRNRNMSSISRDAVEKALSTLPNIPVVGEYSEANKDYKGHGGQIDLDSYKFIHTTKPYGVVPESATYEWEEVRGADGATREYLVINGIYLWTGRYEEAFSVIDSGKGQSMEIEVTDGRWNDEDEVFEIDNFVFSALCILGDDVEPAFEDANITAYSLDKDSFKAEFNLMLKELKSSLSNKKEVDNMKLKELLEKYSLKIEDLTEKGIDFNEISEDELEAKIIEVFEIDVNEDDKGDEGKIEGEQEPEGQNPEGQEPDTTVEPVVEPEGNEDGDGQEPETVVEPEGNEPVVEPTVDFESRIEELEGELETANQTIDTLTTELEGLRQFKLDTEKAQHEAKAQELFSNFQLTEEDIEGLDIHKFSIEELEEKCYAILGRKMASKKNFSKEDKNKNIKLPLGNEDEEEEKSDPYGGLFEKYNNN